MFTIHPCRRPCSLALFKKVKPGVWAFIEYRLYEICVTVFILCGFFLHSTSIFGISSQWLYTYALSAIKVRHKNSKMEWLSVCPLLFLTIKILSDRCHSVVNEDFILFTAYPKKGYSGFNETWQKTGFTRPFSIKMYEADLVPNLCENFLFLSRSNEKLSRSNEKLSRSNEKLSRSNEELSRSNEKLSRSNEKVSRSNEKVSRSNEKLSRSNEILSRSNEKTISFQREIISF